jgi:magnesium chelatase family protein
MRLRQRRLRVPDRRVTISLPPADLPKQGSGFELPIGIGLLVATGVVPQEKFRLSRGARTPH